MPNSTLNCMTQSTITFHNSNQILALFGAQDCHLRQIRDAVGVEVVVRGDEIQLHGEDAGGRERGEQEQWAKQRLLC